MKTYLGDSVYAEFDGYHIVLTTENGFGPSNTICLEDSVLRALIQFADSLKTRPKVTIDPCPSPFDIESSGVKHD